MNKLFSNERENKIFEEVSNDPEEYLEMADKLKMAADTNVLFDKYRVLLEKRCL